LVEFNPDGSIKLPQRIEQKRKEEEWRMNAGHCIRVRKDVVSVKPPKKCILHITLSEKIADNHFISGVHDSFRLNSEVATKLEKVNEKEFRIHIDTAFRRCKECANLIAGYKQVLSGNLIEEKGTCYHEERQMSFCQEDYFE
jgi:hypothetical protein